MIKCEVVFDGDEIYCNGKLIGFQEGMSCDYYEVDGSEMFETLEQAAKYCMEQSNE